MSPRLPLDEEVACQIMLGVDEARYSLNRYPNSGVLEYFGKALRILKRLEI